MSSSPVSSAEIFKATGLKQRVTTAAIMVAIFLLLVFWSSLFWFQLAVGVLFLMAAWEWADLSGFSGRVQKSFYVVAILGAAMLLHFVFRLAFFPVYLFVEPNFFYPALVQLLMLIAVIFWVVALLLIVAYPKCAAMLANRFVRGMVGFFVLLPTWAGVIFLKQQHESGGLVLWVVAIIALADIGAYFVGVRFGKHKLASAVSPGKSWEGVFGGIICNSVLVAGLTVYWHLAKTETLLLFVVTVMVVAFSIVGDLFESMIKRQRGVKDSGNILPGHGGILDRIDGWMAAVPVFTLAYIVLAV